jgi:3-hydroxyisobutyrate dehydrogenase
VLKALRNALVAVELSAMAEVVAVARANGLGPEALLEVLERGGGPASPVLRRALAASLAPPRPVTFTTALSLKDIRIALDLAGIAGVPAPTMGTAADLLARLVDEGHGAAAHTSVVDVY